MHFEEALRVVRLPPALGQQMGHDTFVSDAFDSKAGKNIYMGFHS